VTFQWLQGAAQYALKGTQVPDSRIKNTAEALVAQTQADIGQLADKLRAKTISLAEFEAGMRRALDRNEIAQSALAHGGWGGLSPPVIERASNRLATQYEYLRGFAEAIGQGQLSPAQIGARAVSYADAGRSSYENEFADAKKESGFELACRILGASDSCGGCVEAAADGWVAIDDLLPIGNAECSNRCHCVVIFRRDEEASESPAAAKQIERAQEKHAAYQELKAAKETTNG